MNNLEDLHYSKPKHNEIKQKLLPFRIFLEHENYTSQSDTTRTTEKHRRRRPQNHAYKKIPTLSCNENIIRSMSQ